MGAIDVRPILFVIGSLLSIVALAMLVPMVADLAAGHPNWQVFAASSVCTLFFGVLILLTNRSTDQRLTLRQTFLLTTLSWIAIVAFAALPFAFGDLRLSYTDAFFEAMSGLTTTGSTVIAGLDGAPPGVLMWRALLTWMGGIGIVVLGIGILPFLRVGGMQLFRSESSEKSEKVVPRATDLSVWLGWIYVGKTAACAVAFALAGMPLFEAVANSMTATATGGFATRDASIGGFQNPAVEWIAVVAMVAGSLPFVRYISLLRGDAGALWRDSQVRRFLSVAAGVSAAVSAWLWLEKGLPFWTALRQGTFNVVSIITTTGYATADYTAWGAPAVILFFVLTFSGGCTGSTTGGIKIFRFEVLGMVMKQQMTRLYSPRRVMPLTYNEKPVDNDILLSVTAFIFVYFTTILVIALLLGMFGLDFVTAVSGATTAVCNVGPGLGPIIGPAGNFAALPDGAKWVLSAGMLLGRLELFTVLVLFNPRFWRS